LGLTFCKMAIEAHKCEIGVLSEIDRGSEFYFYLPRSEDSIIEGNTENKVEGNDSNPLNSLVFTLEDMVLMKRFNKKIDILEIYETGEWLTIFDEIDDDSSRNIQKWKQMMMEAITNFDEKAFLHLKKVVSLEVNQ